MEKLSAKEVTQLLQKKKFPDTIIEVFQSNFIDGEALMSLPNDMQEFSLMVPQSGLRIKIRNLIKCYVDEESQLTSLSAVGAQISTSLSTLHNYSDDNWLIDDCFQEPTASSSIIEYSDTEDLSPAQLEDSKHSDSVGDCKISTTPAKKAKIDDIGYSKDAIATPVSQLRLPTLCPVPNTFTPDVTNAILQQKVAGVMKTKLLRQAATFYWGMCPCPNVEEYSKMSIKLCDAFPQIRDKRPINGKYWHSVNEYLSQKFRNFRRISVPLESTSSTSTQSKPSKVTAKNAIPSASEGTSNSSLQLDLVAYERNMQSISKEMDKSHSKVGTMKLLLKLTFDARRHKINMSMSRTLELLKEYPFFKDSRWVINELELMCGELTRTKFIENWEQYMPKLLDGCAPNNYKAIGIMDKKLRSAGPFAKSPAVFCIYQLGSNFEEILNEKTFSEPRLVIFHDEKESSNDQGFIVAEKEVLFEVNGFNVIEGMLSLIASYYALYISYPKSAPATGVLLFMQEMLLEQPDSKIKKTAKYNALVNMLSS